LKVEKWKVERLKVESLESGKEIKGRKLVKVRRIKSDCS
jgi:hypothetical protein